MLYTFNPEHPGQCGYAYPGGPFIVAGDTVELDAAQADRLNGTVAGVDGAPALVPVAAEAVVPDHSADHRHAAKAPRRAK